MRSKVATITTNGSGAATATVGMPTSLVYAVQITDTTATGGTVTIANMGRDILDAIDPSVENAYPLREQVTEADGTPVAAYRPYAVHGSLGVTVAGAGANKSFTIVLLHE